MGDAKRRLSFMKEPGWKNPNGDDIRGFPMADQAPPEWGKKIMHARMTVGDTVADGLGMRRRTL